MKDNKQYIGVGNVKEVKDLEKQEQKEREKRALKAAKEAAETRRKVIPVIFIIALICLVAFAVNDSIEENEKREVARVEQMQKQAAKKEKEDKIIAQWNKLAKDYPHKNFSNNKLRSEFTPQYIRRHLEKEIRDSIANVEKAKQAKLYQRELNRKIRVVKENNKKYIAKHKRYNANPHKVRPSIYGTDLENKVKLGGVKFFENLTSGEIMSIHGDQYDLTSRQKRVLKGWVHAVRILVDQ